MRYVDAHAHVQFPPYDGDRRELIARMKEEGVHGIVVGVDRTSSEKAVALAQEHEHLYAAVGLHPNDNTKEGFDLETYRRLAADPSVVAIGECGLDYFRPENPEAEKVRQKPLFASQIELALSVDKPLIIHSRPSKGTQDAYRDVIDLLRTYKRQFGEKLRGDVHFFVGGVEEARDFIELGFTLSFTAVITFARDYDEVIRYVPLTSILTETDAPYVAPASRRGQRNDPFAVKDVVEALAEIRGEAAEAVRQQTVQNAADLFSLGGPSQNKAETAGAPGR